MTRTKKRKEWTYVKVRLFCPRFVPEEGVFAQDELLHFLEDKELIDCATHFFMHDSFPRLLMVVTYRDNKSGGDQRTHTSPEPRQTKSDSTTPQPIKLTHEEKVRFEGLRRWRNERAKQDGVSGYLVLSNRVLEEISRKQPTTLATLEEIFGVGKVTIGRYGKEILECLQTIKQAEESSTK